MAFFFFKRHLAIFGIGLLSFSSGFANEFYSQQQNFPRRLFSNPYRSASLTRDYSREVSEKEKKNISYIITTLGNKPLTRVWKEKSELKKVGDRINAIHPLRFLMCVFTDENLKVAMHNLKGRDWVWNEFKKGLYHSLDEETAAQNMHLEYIQHFSDTLLIQSSLILPAIQQGKWDDFIYLLLKYVPREGDPGRYNI